MENGEAGRGGLNPNARDGQGRTALHHLCQQPALTGADVAHLRQLLQLGADVSARDEFGRTPLALVCRESGHPEAVAALLGAKAAADSEDDWGRTPLHWCCDRSHLVAAELLLEHGSPIDARTKQGDTPLMWAAKAGHPELVQLLLSAGARTRLRNNRGEFAEGLAADDLVRVQIISASAEEQAAADQGEGTLQRPLPVAEAEINGTQARREASVGGTTSDAPGSALVAQPAEPGGQQSGLAFGPAPVQGGEAKPVAATKAFSAFVGKGSGASSERPKKLKISLKKS